MRKRPVLLLELVISLVLFGIIMGMLFSSYRELTLGKVLLREEKETILKEQKLQLRLSQIFSHLQDIEKKKEVYFLKYDNGLDPDPDFRGVLEGMLYIDHGQLMLVTWTEKEASRKEILWESASSIGVSFFDAKKGVFRETFPDEQPFMMKVEINKWEIPLFL